jgi:magnesium transporter
MMTASVNSGASALAEGFLTAYPAEVARIAELWDSNALLELFRGRTAEQGAQLLEHLVPEAAARVADGLDSDQVSPMLMRLDPARVAAALGRIDADRQQRVLAHFPPRVADEVRELVSYPANAAGSLMDVHVATFRQDAPAGRVLTLLREGKSPGATGVVVVDDEGRLSGTLDAVDVALAQPQTPVGTLMRGAPGRIQALAPREDVVDELSRLKLTSLPVVDAEDRVVGIIRHDALVRALHEEVSVDMQTMVGVSAEERALSPVAFVVRKRLPWLQINLVTAFMAAAIVGFFEDTIAQVTALAVLLPVVAGQSGNTGAQALAVTMRGLSLREIRLRHWRQLWTKETTVGFVNGVGVALTTSVAVYLWSRSAGLSAVIGLSMVLSMTCAGLAGAVVPMALVAARQDPAQASSIILTTVTDIVGFFSFLGIATLLLSSL